MRAGAAFMAHLTPSLYELLSNMTVMFCDKPHLCFLDLNWIPNFKFINGKKKNKKTPPKQNKNKKITFLSFTHHQRKCVQV